MHRFEIFIKTSHVKLVGSPCTSFLKNAFSECVKATGKWNLENCKIIRQIEECSIRALSFAILRGEHETKKAIK